jgi:subtilisin-like proprotein convertase family protein
MKAKLFFIPSFCFCFSSAALANVNEGDVPFIFSYTAAGGVIPELDTPPADNEGISTFPLFMNNEVPNILSIELELTGLFHSDPDDLDIYLINPFGTTVEIMSDRGDQVAILGATLVFNDFTGTSVPPDEAEIVSGTYLPEGTVEGHGGGMNNFVKQSGGTDAWILMIIDDAPEDSGFLASWTLRGFAVPEPMTLSLLAMGAFAVLRRKRA